MRARRTLGVQIEALSRGIEQLSAYNELAPYAGHEHEHAQPYTVHYKFAASTPQEPEVSSP